MVLIWRHSLKKSRVDGYSDGRKSIFQFWSRRWFYSVKLCYIFFVLLVVSDSSLPTLSNLTTSPTILRWSLNLIMSLFLRQYRKENTKLCFLLVLLMSSSLFFIVLFTYPDFSRFDFSHNFIMFLIYYLFSFYIFFFTIIL